MNWRDEVNIRGQSIYGNGEDMTYYFWLGREAESMHYGWRVGEKNVKDTVKNDGRNTSDGE